MIQGIQIYRVAPLSVLHDLAHGSYRAVRRVKLSAASQSRNAERIRESTVQRVRKWRLFASLSGP